MGPFRGRLALSGGRGFLLFLCVVAVLYAAGVNSYWRFQRDSALYMGLARSLAEDGTYSFNGEPHIFAWPGFPAMLSLLYMTVGESFLWMNALISLFGLGCVAAAWALFRQLPLTHRQVEACTVLFGLSRTLYYYSSHIMSEVPFTFFSLLSLACGAMMLRRSGRAGWLWCVGAAAAACAACFVRPLGPALLSALVLAVWLSPGGFKGWRQSALRTLVILSPILLLGLAWAVRCALTGSPESYRYYDSFIGRFSAAELIMRMARRVPELVEALPDTVLGVDLWMTGGVLLAGVMALGLVTGFRRDERLVGLYGLTYLAAICVGSPGRRYLQPALPVLLYWLILGCHTAGLLLRERARLFSARQAAAVLRVLLALAVATNVVRIGKLVYEARAPGFYGRIEDGKLIDYFELADWLKANAEGRDVVLAREDQMLHYFSRVRTLRVPRRWAKWQLRSAAEFLRERNVSLLIRDPGKDERTAAVPQLIRAFPGAFERVRNFGPLEVIRVHADRLAPPQD